MTAIKKQGAAHRTEQNPDDEMLENKSIELLRDKIRGIIYHEATNFHSRRQNKIPREIVIQAELLPFHFATRSVQVLDDGTPWRHDGGQVRFHINQSHDELEVYTPQGEFVKSFPVSKDGRVNVSELEKGVYVLYLRGRKISSLSPSV
jgi:hypothetical protein